MTSRIQAGNERWSSLLRIVWTFVACAMLTSLAVPANAGTREQARRIHDRLVGVPPDATTLQLMVDRIDALDPLGAADIAMQHPAFYRTALKSFATPWTNVEGDVFAPLNDYSATVIGMIRDNVPWNQVLSADLVYTGAGGVVPSAYSHTDNDHYEELEANRVDLSDPNLFIGVPQSGLPGSVLQPGDAAGVTTTRAARRSLLQRGDQSAHVAIHLDESHVPRPRGDEGHHAARRSHPPGCEPESGWR